MKTLVHPYGNLQGGEWLRGNLHTHTTASDGARPVQETINEYAARGYGFLMISDHDTVMSAEEYAALDKRGLALILGREISKGGPHVLHVHADVRVDSLAPRQSTLDRIAAGRGFAIVCHPNWEQDFDHCPLEQMIAWTGYAGMEIYNGTIGRLDGSPYATDKWDMLLTRGRRVWGFANDDCHLAGDDLGLGWNVAYVTQRTPDGVVAALAAGRFYASTGVTITRIDVSGMRIRVETRDAARIVALRDVGRRFAQVDSRALEVEAPADARYVRFECWGAGEKFAWTQPFFPAEAE